MFLTRLPLDCLEGLFLYLGSLPKVNIDILDLFVNVDVESWLLHVIQVVSQFFLVLLLFFFVVSQIGARTSTLGTLLFTGALEWH